MILKRLISTTALCFALLILFSTDKVYADTPIATDSRIRTLVYSENEVFKLTTQYGYQSNIEFGKGEEVITLSVGNSAAFKVTPSGGRLFVKTLQGNSHTNMTVITNYHTYQFDISSVVNNEQDVIYVMRFYYPEESFDNSGAEVFKTATKEIPVREFAAPISANKAPVLGSSMQMQGNYKPELSMQENYNYNYSILGPDNLAPLKIFDNGLSTFFKLQGNMRAPVFYSISPDGFEHLTAPLISKQDGEYIVLEGVFDKLSLRYGPDVICVFNDNLTSMR